MSLNHIVQVSLLLNHYSNVDENARYQKKNTKEGACTQKSMKSNQHAATKKRKQNPRPDLLGCICLDADCEDPDADHGCRRNCRRENVDWDEPDDAELVFISPQPPLMDEPSNIAYERVLLQEDQRPDKQVVALAAWSNGQIKIWFA
jgi:hypothetical protein